MAEISEKNIIYSIDKGKNELLGELDKTGKAVTSLEKDLKKAGTDSEKAFATAGKSLKEYNQLILKGEQNSKRLSREIREQQKITNEFQSKLGLLNTRLQNVSKSSVEFRKLTKEAKQLKEAIDDNNVAIKGLKLEKAQVDETVKSFKELAKGSNESATGLRDVESALSRVSPEFSRASSGAQSLIRTLTSIGPLGAVIGAGLVAIVGPVSLAFTRIQSRSDELRVRLAGLRVTFDRFLDSAARFGDRILSGNFTNITDEESARRFFTGGGILSKEQQAEIERLRKEEKEARIEAQKIERESFNLQDQRIAFIEREAQLEAIIADSREKISAEETTRVEAIKAIEIAESAINELFGKRVEFQQKENQLLIRKNALTISGRAEAEEEARNAAELFNLQRQQSEAIKTLNRDKRRALNIDKQSKQVSEKQLEIAVNSIAGIQRQIQFFQDLVNKESDAATRLSLLQSIDEFQEELKAIEEQIKLFKSRVNREAPLIEIVSSVEGEDTLLSAIEKSLLNVRNFTKGLEEDIFDKNLLKKNAEELLQVASQLTQSLLREETERKDRQIDIARDRVESFRSLAEKGSAEQLQIEEERLASLIEARERSAQREKAIASLQIAAANAVAIAEGIKNVTQGFAKGPIAGIANALALAATIGATILAIRNATSSIPAFAEGTEYVKLNGAPKGKDTVLARVDEGERIVSKRDNAKFGGKSAAKLVEAVKFYDTHHKIRSQEFRGGSHFSDSNIVSEIRYMREEIRDLQMTMRVDEYGLSAGIERATRRRQRIKNLR